jgi:hypothetical protein
MDPITERQTEGRVRQLRRRAIVLAKLQGSQYADRWIPARQFLQVRDDQGEQIHGEEAVTLMLESLIELGLIEEWKPMSLLSSGKTGGFGQRRFRLTDRGYALWAQEIDPIPSIADERLGD